MKERVKPTGTTKQNTTSAVLDRGGVVRKSSGPSPHSRLRISRDSFLRGDDAEDSFVDDTLKNLRQRLKE